VDGKQQMVVERLLSRTSEEIIKTLEKGEKSG
jgi:hypothetical protein